MCLLAEDPFLFSTQALLCSILIGELCSVMPSRKYQMRTAVIPLSADELIVSSTFLVAVCCCSYLWCHCHKPPRDSRSWPSDRCYALRHVRPHDLEIVDQLAPQFSDSWACCM